MPSIYHNKMEFVGLLLMLEYPYCSYLRLLTKTILYSTISIHCCSSKLLYIFSVPIHYWSSKQFEIRTVFICYYFSIKFHMDTVSICFWSPIWFENPALFPNSITHQNSSRLILFIFTIFRDSHCPQFSKFVLSTKIVLISIEYPSVPIYF